MSLKETGAIGRQNRANLPVPLALCAPMRTVGAIPYSESP